DLRQAGGEDAAEVEVMPADPQLAVPGALAHGGLGVGALDGAHDLEAADAEDPHLVRHGHEEVLAVAGDVDRQGPIVEVGDIGGLRTGDRPLTGARALDGGLAPHDAASLTRASRAGAASGAGGWPGTRPGPLGDDQMWMTR